MKQLDELNRLSESHGALQPGKGTISGVVALSLAVLCFLGVLAFHFPPYLTTPELRKSYSVGVMHHSADAEGIDRNDAAHFAFIDYAFGTAHKAERECPDGYGVVSDYVPNGCFKQLAFPFRWKG